MNQKHQPRRSGPRDSSNQRVPLNYYQSRTLASDRSPFKARENPKPHTLRKYIVRGIDVALIVLILVGLIYSLSVGGNATVIVNDTSYHSKSQYAKTATEGLSTLKDSNKISFDQDDLVNRLQKAYPEISAASVELPFFGRQPVVRLEIATPAFILNTNGQKVVLDSEGIVIGQISQFKNLAAMDEITDTTSYNVDIGHQFLSSYDIRFIKYVLGQTRASGVPVGKIQLPTSPQELNLYASDQAYYVKFYTGGDAARQTGQYLAARKQFKSGGDTPKDYLDVRINGKIFYK